MLNQTEKKLLEKKLATQISLEESEQILETQSLFPCGQCQRKFTREALDKHSKVCKMVFGTKRVEFDSQFQRLGGKPFDLILSQRQRSSSRSKTDAKSRNDSGCRKGAYGVIKPDKDGRYTVIH